MGRSIEDVRALVLTHGHSDHIGFAERIRVDRRRAGGPRARNHLRARPELPRRSVGSRKVLWNAVFGPDPHRRAAAAVTHDANEVARRIPQLVDDATMNALLVSVPPGEAAAARSVLASFGSGVHRVPTFDHEAVLLAVDNPNVHSFEQHPFAREIPGALQSAGIECSGSVRRSSVGG